MNGAPHMAPRLFFEEYCYWYLQGALCRQDPSHPRIGLHRVTERTGKGLEARLNDMMWISALGHIEMQVHAYLIGKSQKKIVDEFGSKIADFFLANVEIIGQKGPPAKVYHA